MIAAVSPRARRAVPAVALVLLLLGVAIAVVVRRSGPAHPPTGPLPVRTDVAFGAWTPPTSGPLGAGIAELEQALGRRLDIVADYPQWGADEAEFSPDDAARLRAEAADGRVPLLTWEPWDGSDGADRSAFSARPEHRPAIAAKRRRLAEAMAGAA